MVKVTGFLFSLSHQFGGGGKFDEFTLFKHLAKKFGKLVDYPIGKY